MDIHFHCLPFHKGLNPTGLGLVSPVSEAPLHCAGFNLLPQCRSLSEAPFYNV
jgi:hypothetical protein